MLIQLIVTLQKIDLTMTAEEIADMLWLASHIGAAQVATEVESSSQNSDEAPVLEADQLSLDMQGMLSSPLPTLNSYIYPITHRSGVQSETRGSFFRSPAASALPNTLLLARALRPMMRRMASKTQFVLNEQATVQYVAETQQKIWMPVLDSMPVRWFDVELVIDEGTSMFLWRQVVIEWKALLEHHGAFRNVRTWRMITNDHERVELYLGIRATKEHLHPHNPKELIDPGGHRLILVITDCISPAWHSGNVQALLDIWGHKNLVSLIQVFPRRLWRQTTLTNADIIQINALSPFTSNHQLKTHGSDKWFDEDLPMRDTITYPIVTLDHRSLYNWARMITGTELLWVPGVCFSGSEVGFENEEEIASSQVPLFPMKRVQLFHANASLTARKLIGLLAAAPIPIDLEVIRLIQHTLVPEADQVHVAEILLSGLLEQIDNNFTEHELNNVEYDFLPGVRDELLNTVPIPAADEVFREISLFVERRQGKIRDFPALITPPDKTDQDVFIADESHPFAQITSTIQRRYGKDFATVVQKIEQSVQPLSVQPSEVKEIVENDFREDSYEKDVDASGVSMDVSMIDIIDLAERLEERKNSGRRIALILGSRAGALFRNKDFLEEMAPYSTRRSFSVDTNEIGRFSECYDLLKKAKGLEAPGDLEKFLNEQIKNTGYSFADECMADLVKQKIFKLILSFNPDDILYDAFTAAALKKNEDFAEIDFDRFGRYTIEGIRNHTKRACVVIKLFNDMNAFVHSLDRPKVQEEAGLWVRHLLDEWRIKEVLMVGVDLTWDHIILSALPSDLKTIWFVNENNQENDKLYSQYKNVEQFRYIIGGKGEYEKFFQMLYWQISARVLPPHYEQNAQLENEVNAMQGDMRRIKNEIEKIRSDQNYMIRDITSILRLLEEERSRNE